MPGISKPPRLVNRGPGGLLSKLPEHLGSKVVVPEIVDKGIDRIIDDLLPLAVPIDQPIFDPANARKHPERNMQAIIDAYKLYGQRTPIVINRRTGHVLKGNGSLQACRTMGWTKIAAVWVDDDEATAAGYGLADNRAGELAAWDFQTVAMLDKIISEAGMPTIGWTTDELEVLRAADWTPPAINEGNGDGKADKKSLLCSWTPDQHVIVTQAVNEMRQQKDDSELDQAAALEAICMAWLESLVGVTADSEMGFPGVPELEPEEVS